MNGQKLVGLLVEGIWLIKFFPFVKEYFFEWFPFEGVYIHCIATIRRFRWIWGFGVGVLLLVFWDIGSF